MIISGKVAYLLLLVRDSLAASPAVCAELCGDGRGVPGLGKEAPAPLQPAAAARHHSWSMPG